jgi:hypothetical protein
VANGGVDIGEIISLLDQIKIELRQELASKKELDDVEVRMGNIEEDFDNITLSQDIQIKKTKENTDEIESNRT